MKQQKQYIRWTSEENFKLLEIVSIYKNNNKQANWEEIQVQFPNHTIQQLKSQYSNIKNAKPTLYHTWSEVDETILYLCVINYGQDWVKIQQTNFQFVSKASLKSKWHKYIKEQSKIQYILELLKSGNPQIAEINSVLLNQTSRHIQLLYKILSDNSNQDIIQQVNKLLISYDIQVILDNYKKELKRRNLMVIGNQM
ncbi:Myb-like_DNA-binding domain-containing protein [Hexamita inflata]|uniref:Myb-like_DNA-binding domain-containing protein n=1 Tax=Hexamita inflata TaxID=28002 RepID=A0ABP1GGU5_9EUKA